MSAGGEKRAEPRRTRRAATLALGLAAGLVALGAPAARAHSLGDSYLYLQIYESSVSGRFEIALSDLNPALGLSGTELEITAQNLDERIGFLEGYYHDHVVISDERGPLEIEFTGHRLLSAEGDYVLLPFELEGLAGVPETLTFDYGVLFDEEPSHRGFLLVEHNWATGTFANENRISLVFGPSSRKQVLNLTSSGRLRGFLALARLGAEHMLEGLDHLLFLVALLLPTVLRRDRGGWKALERLRPALWNVVVVVTAFFVAHGLALGLVALGLVRLPPAVVETAIAGSIAIAALDVFLPVLRGPAWWMVFGLSLFHGLGFAAALLDLGVLEEHLGLSLAAFNLGVESGQLVVVAVLFPLLFLLRRSKAYRRAALPAAAAALIAVAAVWTAERAFGVDVPMRELLPPAVQKVIP